MKKKKQTKHIITGYTRNHFNNHSGFLSKSKDSREKCYVANCYLCKRAAGEESMIIDANNNSLHFSPIELDYWEATIDGCCSYGYWLCHECAILAGQFATYADISWIYKERGP